MRIRSRTLPVLALLVLAQLSCATVPLTSDPESMPAARLALPVEQRVFYDTLEGYGDWLLIEPLGYVFRPYDSDEYWHPYLYGYWAPSEMYGWVWISSEPYGWATYHYGAWFYDDYQGWVWIPGDDWGPAWVSWVMTDDYVGWAPLLPPGYSTELAPGGGYLYVTIGSLAAPDLPRRARTPAPRGGARGPPGRGAGLASSRRRRDERARRDGGPPARPRSQGDDAMTGGPQTAAEIRAALGTPVAVDNLRERGGVVFNAGPAFGVVERHTGPLPRVQLEDLAPAPDGGAAAGIRRGPERGRETAAPSSVRRSGEEAAQRARSVTQRGAAPPPTVGVLRPDLRRAGARAVRADTPPATRPRPATPRGAGADSTTRR